MNAHYQQLADHYDVATVWFGRRSLVKNAVKVMNKRVKDHLEDEVDFA